MLPITAYRVRRAKSEAVRDRIKACRGAAEEDGGMTTVSQVWWRLDAPDHRVPCAAGGVGDGAGSDGKEARKGCAGVRRRYDPLSAPPNAWPLRAVTPVWFELERLETGVIRKSAL